MARQRRDTNLQPPFLKRVWLPERDTQAWPDWADWDEYPLNIHLVKNGAFDIRFNSAVTIIVGENGAGKSTLIEAIARCCGFSDSGGGQGMRAVGESTASGVDGGVLGSLLKASWLPQVRNGWFFRAETFFSVARYLDDAGSPIADYLSLSHGEGFLDFFGERLDRQGIYFFDEPESALSPARQFDFLKILRRIQREGRSQIIMATHSPILMGLPDADLWHVTRFGIQPIALEDTDHFRIYREFVMYPRETIEAMTE